MNRHKSLLTALVLVAAGAAAACKTDRDHEQPSPTDFPCICGTPEADMEACLHPACAGGETNPDNPDCACGTLTFGKEKE